MSDGRAFTITIDKSDAGLRLDSVVGAYTSEISRSHISALIKNGVIRVDNNIKKPGYKVKEGETINGVISFQKAGELHPEPVPIYILYEDDHLMVLNKPPGLVVHPSPGHFTATLVHGLLFHCPDIKDTGDEQRPGIVHRLDKGTSGLLVVAKTPTAHKRLSLQFQNRTIRKEYLALVWGRMETNSGQITFPVGRHHRERKKMSINSPSGRIAETLWEIKKQFSWAALLSLNLKTGRTHQIRVHCAAIGHPVLGDVIYSRKKNTLLKTSDGIEISVPRQMLHAWKISFRHPFENKSLNFQAPVPQDMRTIIHFFKKEAIMG